MAFERLKDYFKQNNTKSIYLIPLRFVVGLIFFQMALEKLIDQSDPLRFAKNQVISLQMEMPWDFYRKFLGVYILPYFTFFFYAFLIAEFLVAAFLVTGFRAKMATTIGIFLAINYYFLSAWESGLSSGFHLLLLASLISLLLCLKGPLFPLSLFSKK